ncbi:MAG TPA: glycosyltransferase [Acidimicrobiales bacterium]
MLQTAPPTVAVVIPARNEAPTVAAVVRAVVALDAVAEVVVVDDGSTDGTAALAAAAGATVVAASSPTPGKGSAMRDGVAATSSDIVVFCDADLEAFDTAFVTGLVDVLVAGGGRTALVKADYVRAGEGGRVTELAARPILDLLHPHVAHVAQPLGGEYAAWRSVLVEVPFVRGYGVELGLLLDIAARYGVAAIDQAHVGVRHHRNRPLRDLRPQAKEVLAVALERAGVPGVTVEECPPLAPRSARRRLA